MWNVTFSYASVGDELIARDQGRLEYKIARASEEMHPATKPRDRRS